MYTSFNILLFLRAFSVAILIVCIQTSNAQTPCKYDWGIPQSAELRNRNRPPNIKALPGASFKVRYKTPCNCNNADNQLFAIGPVGVPGSAPAFIKLKLKGYDCEGKISIATIQSSEGLLPGQYSEDKTFAHFKDWLNITVLRVQIDFTLENKKYSYVSDYETGLDETYIDYKPFSKLASEKENTKNDINAAIKNYNREYKEAINVVGKIKDKAKRKELLQEVEANHSQFDKYDKEAQTDLTSFDLDGLKKAFDQIKKQQDGLANIVGKATTKDDAATKELVKNTVTNNNPANNTSTTPVSQPNVTLPGVQTSTPQVAQQQSGQVFGVISSSLTQFANAYGSAIDANYANWKVAFANANAMMDLVNDSVEFYNKQANEGTDYFMRLQYKIRALWFNCMSCYNNNMLNNTRYDFTRKDITTGNYIGFKLSNNPSTAYKFVGLDRYEMPDVLTIPLCQLTDTKIQRQDDYRKAFSLINKCKSCNNLEFAVGQNQWQSERIKCKITETYDEAMAINLLQQSLYSAKIVNNIDKLDYAVARAWYNNLKLKNSKSTQDLLDMIKANKTYLDKASKSGLGLYEQLYANFADKIADYYLLCAVQAYCNATGKTGGLAIIASTSLIGSYDFSNSSVSTALKYLLQ